MGKAVRLHGLRKNPDKSKVMKACVPIMDIFGFISLRFTFLDNSQAYAQTALDQITFSAFLSCLPGSFMTVEHGKVTGVSTHTDVHFASDYKVVSKCPFCKSDLWFSESGPRCSATSSLKCPGRMSAKISHFGRSTLFSMPGFDFNFCLELQKKLPEIRVCTDIMRPDFCIYQAVDYIPQSDIASLYSSTQTFIRELTSPESRQSSFRFFIESQYFKALSIDGMTDKLIHELVSIGMAAGDSPILGVFHKLMDLDGRYSNSTAPINRDLYNEHERLRQECSAMEGILDTDG